MVIIIFGLPGTGKSYFASRLAKVIQADYINTDQLRKELYKKPDYSKNEKRIIYTRLLNRMSDYAEREKTLIMDGTFYTNEIRTEFLKLAEKSNIDLRWIQIEANEHIIKQRTKIKRQYSDADYGIYQQIKDQFEPFNNPQHIRLTSNDHNIAEMIQQAKAFLEN